MCDGGVGRIQPANEDVIRRDILSAELHVDVNVE